MTRLLLVVLTSSLCLPFGLQEAAARKSPELVLRAETFSDEAMTEPATVFAPGATIFYRLTAKAPAAAQDKTATVGLSAKATVAGIRIPGTLKTALKLQLTDPIDPSKPLGFDGTEQVHVGKVRVPTFLLDAKLELKATVRIGNMGSVTAQNAVTIEQ